MKKYFCSIHAFILYILLFSLNQQPTPKCVSFRFEDAKDQKATTKCTECVILRTMAPGQPKYCA